MAHAYPIWIDVTSWGYKSSKSYGAKDDTKEIVNVGTSSKYSHKLCTRSVTRRFKDNYRGFKNVIVFRVYHNDIIIDELVMSKKTKEVLEHRTAEIKGL